MYAYDIIVFISIFILMFLVATTYIVYHKKKYLWFIPYGILSSVLSFFLGWALAILVMAITKNTNPDSDSELILIMIFHTFFCIIFAIWFLKKKCKEVNRTNFVMLTMFNISLFIVIYSALMLFLFSRILGSDFVFKNIGFILLNIITSKP